MIECTCFLTKCAKGYSEVVMSPSQISLNEQFSEVISSRIPIDKEIVLYLIKKEFQRWQMSSNQFFVQLV